MYNDNHNNHNENNINAFAFENVVGIFALFSTNLTRGTEFNSIELNRSQVFDGNYRYSYSLFGVGVSVSISVGVLRLESI